MTKKETKKENKNTSAAELPEDDKAEGLDTVNVSQVQIPLEESAVGKSAPEQDAVSQEASEKGASEKGASEKDTSEKDASGKEVAGKDAGSEADALTEAEVLADGEVTEEDSAPLKPGAQLAVIREAAGIEQEVVASSLKMTLRQIRALEVDDYDVLHGIAISRGFVRAYAKFLQVDPEPLVAMFPSTDSITRPLERLPVRNKPERVVHHTDRRFGDKRKSSRRGIIIALALLLALAYGAYIMKWLPTKWMPLMKGSEVTQSKAGSADASAAESGADKRTAGEAGKDQQAASATDTENSPGGQNRQDSQDKATDEAGSNAGAQNQQPDALKASQNQPEPAQNAASADLLLMRFKGPSNVRILNADSSVISEFDGNTGDVQMLEITEPATLVVEKADNVDVEFRSAAIFLRAARRSTEARVELK